MTGLQNGTPAQMLAPQNYSNSSQDTVFQNATGRDVFQNTPSTGQTLSTPAQGSGLRVSGNRPTSAVLGIDTIALNKEVSQANNQTLVAPMLLVATLSFLLFIVFWKQARSTVADVIESHDKESKD